MMAHQTAACAILILIALSNSFQIDRSGNNVRCRCLSQCRRDGRRLYNMQDADEYLDGIGVGIDLGTTNSAVAMMLPARDGKR